MDKKSIHLIVSNLLALLFLISQFYACSGVANLSKKTSVSESTGEVLIRLNVENGKEKYLAWTRGEDESNYPIDEIIFSISLYYYRDVDVDEEPDIDIVEFRNILFSQFTGGLILTELEPWDDVSVVISGYFRNEYVYHGQAVIDIIANQRSELTITLNEINAENGGSGTLTAPSVEPAPALSFGELSINATINNNPVISEWFTDFGNMERFDPTSLIVMDIDNVRLLSFSNLIVLWGYVFANDTDGDNVIFKTYIGYNNEEAITQIFCNPLINTDDPNVSVSSFTPQSFNCLFTPSQFENVTSFKMVIEDNRGGLAETGINITQNI